MTNDFKLEIQLEQYTPLLHFQGEQDGACLRATEVKPKLDKFVLEFLKHQLGSCDKIPKEWFVQKNSHDALNYKMSFEPVRIQEEIEELEELEELHPLYFGDRGKNEGQVKNVYYPRGMKLHILCLIEKECAVTMPDGNIARRLLDVLEQMIPVFFMLNCFGMRSNKGFGSFGVAGKTIPVSQLSEFAPKKCTAIFELKHIKEEYTYPQNLDDVYVISAMMKGGINRPYFKGEIQKLSENHKIGTEKAFLKQKVFRREEMRWYRDVVCHGNDHTPKQTYREYQFIRALLGLTTQYSFGVGKKNTFSFEASDKNIGRFPSPIHFIPKKECLLITLYEIPEIMLDAEFTIRRKSIKTPKNFDLVGFVRNFLDTLVTDGELPNDWNELATNRKYYKKTIKDMRQTDEWRRI